jgi:hypothetical protein
MELNDALLQIADIRGQIARSGTFRGYRSVPTALSGGIALLAAAAQQRWVPNPYQSLDAYLWIWFGAAMLSLFTVALEMILRLRRSGCTVQREMSLAAAEHFFPCLAAGALMTFVIVQYATETAWMLPGLWMILFSLGVFSSRRFLPRQAVVVGGFYMVTGALVISMRLGAALAPWTMGLPFGLGQLATAALFYFTLERSSRERGDEHR